ncbi:MAG: VTT domain-containing protein [Patescibacteria group bacterium]
MRVAIAYLVIIVLASAVLHAYGHTPSDVPEMISVAVLQAGLFGPALMVLVFALSFFLPAPTILLASVAGLLFGNWLGLGLSIVGLNLSSWLLFGIARALGAKKIAQSKKPWLRHANKILTQKGFASVFLGRLLLVPYDGVSIAAGLSGIGFKDYAAATFLGSLPSIVVLVLCGGYADKPETRIAMAIVVVVLLMVVYLLRKQPRWQKYLP